MKISMGYTKKSLGLLDVFAISTGAMISSGIFILPSIVFGIAGPAVIVSYFLAGLFVIPALMCKAELSTAMPKSGGTYFFVERSLGPFIGTFAGLANWFSVSLKSAFALIGIGIFIRYFVPTIDMNMVKLIASACTLLFLLINLKGVREGSTFQIILVFFLLGIMLFYITTGIEFISIENYTPFRPNGWTSVFSAAAMVFISFGGLTSVASMSEEVKNPGKTIPAGMLLAFFVVMILYLVSVFVTIGLLGKDNLVNSLTPLSDGAKMITGEVGLVLLSLGAMLSFITTANAGLMSASRVPLAMAKDNLLPLLLGKESKKKGIPTVSLLVTSAFMIMVITFLDLKDLVKVASTMMLILFLFDNLSVILMRESRIVTYRPLYKSRLYPWIQILGIVVYVFMIAEMGKLSLLITGGFFLLSLFWYLVFSRKGYRRTSAIVRIVERVTSKEIKTDSLSVELREILFERDEVESDRFDEMILDADIIDIDEKIDRNKLFAILAESISKRMDVASDRVLTLLHAREAESTTAIYPALAIPHIIIEGKVPFAITIVRAKRGVYFSEESSNVTMVFALAGARGERDFHLHALMSIAQIVENPGFEDKWKRARDSEELRNLILISKRKRL